MVNSSARAAWDAARAALDAALDEKHWTLQLHKVAKKADAKAMADEQELRAVLERIAALHPDEPEPEPEPESEPEPKPAPELKVDFLKSILEMYFKKPESFLKSPKSARILERLMLKFGHRWEELPLVVTKVEHALTVLKTTGMVTFEASSFRLEAQHLPGLIKLHTHIALLRDW